MADQMTNQMIHTYDRLRRLRKMTTGLKMERATATGYAQTGRTITAGWYAEFTEDRTTGEQELQVLVAETPHWNPTDVRRYAATVVFNQKRYKIKGKREPEGAPLVWLLTCSATGEAV
jgi:hypothetical protein